MTNVFQPRALALAICCAGALASGCSSVQDRGPLLADLPTAMLPAEPAVEVAEINLAELQQSYERALASNRDPRTRRQIQLRLADIEMERLEQQQADHPETAVAYASAVRRYEQLAAGASSDDYLFYRLARARALNGNTNGALQALQHIVSEAPDSPFMAEALFRRAEVAFSRQDYEAAARDFDAVLGHGDSPFSQNARYMLGWSQFKSARYGAASNTFLALLDGLNENTPLQQLEKGDKRLADDTLRVLALGFNYLGGAEVIESFNPPSGPRIYQHSLYRALGDWYAESERYQDGADTFLTFVQQNPHNREAPAMHVRAIQILQQGNFPSEVLPAKRQFVAQYGIHGNYWQQSGAQQRQRLSGWLRPWLEELARYDHARGQALAAQLRERLKQNNGNSMSSKQRRANEESAQESRRAFLAAAELYRQFAQTFPQDPQTPTLTFLMAECYNEAQQYALAWEAYRQVAWGFQHQGPSVGREGAQAATAPRHTPHYRTEAGYAAILMAGKMQQIDAKIDIEVSTLWLDRKTETSLLFASSWPADKRALPAQLDAANNLFKQNRYAEAIVAVEQAAAWQPQPDISQRKNINLVLGHSQFELKNYPAAEQAYAQILAGLRPEDSDYQATRERLQSSIYKQAEALASAGPTNESVAQLLRVRESGRTEIASTAQYDAINQLISLQQWQRAASEIADFRQYFATHRLTPTLAAKAVVIFQALEMPGAVAGELLQLAATDTDPDVRRDSLFLAAEQFQQAADDQQAIEAYREYIRSWREPALQNLEAQYQLVELYAKSKQQQQRNLWLKSLAGNRVNNERAHYLAAFSQTELAAQSYARFEKLPLRLPLKASLRDKKRAMQDTIGDYRKVLGFKIAEFTTVASYRLAEVYRQLSHDLMESQRPAGLNALELEQYEILLEEQAYPFEEKAIELHQANVSRTAEGIYDEWVKQSFASLEKLLPARYRKPESTIGWSDAVY